MPGLGWGACLPGGAAAREAARRRPPPARAAPQVNACTAKLKANLQEEHLAGMEFIGTVFKTILSPLQKARAIVQSYPFYPDVYQVRLGAGVGLVRVGARAGRENRGCRGGGGGAGSQRAAVCTLEQRCLPPRLTLPPPPLARCRLPRCWRWRSRAARACRAWRGSPRAQAPRRSSPSPLPTSARRRPATPHRTAAVPHGSRAGWRETANATSSMNTYPMPGRGGHTAAWHPKPRLAHALVACTRATKPHPSPTTQPNTTRHAGTSRSPSLVAECPCPPSFPSPLFVPPFTYLR